MNLLDQYIGHPGAGSCSPVVDPGCVSATLMPALGGLLRVSVYSLQARLVSTLGLVKAVLTMAGALSSSTRRQPDPGQFTQSPLTLGAGSR